ncbi:hypothetical protein MNBD_GAMMA26-936 [hydrothermal vent metagenome]|uniref:Zinc finger/thioredoxin putative domain-containing protein n=1 Tax=hydrothermal vent metagenome TaxID=652676 RepID=A0A3B1B3W1_9ZZZZ
MITRCPHCKTTYHIHAKQLEIADGQAHCYYCTQVFDARGNLQEQHPDEAPLSTSSLPPDLTADEMSPQQIEDIIADFEKELQPRILQPPAQKVTKSTSSHRKAAVSLSVKDLLAPARKKRNIVSTLFWLLASLTLVAIAMAQLTWFKREQVVKHPQGKLLLERFCSYAKCQVPQLRNTDLIKVIRRQVSSHPQKTGMLLVRLLFVNQASYPQPFPVLELSLSTTDKQLVARRSFVPGEYLETEKNSTALMPPGISQQIEIEIQDPGHSVTGFEFNFF